MDLIPIARSGRHTVGSIKLQKFSRGKIFHLKIDILPVKVIGRFY